MGKGRLTTIFAKKPEPGSVKTRLCPPLAAAEAAELALAMLDDRVEGCLACGEFETSIRAASTRDLEWFAGRFPRVASIRPQEGADLGARLAAHFEAESRVRRGWTLVVLGSDAPQVHAERVLQAHRALESGSDLVLGPDLGGGYYLVGLSRPAPELFERVPMSTNDMCERTHTLARSLGLRVDLLESDYDVDQPEDLSRLSGEGPHLRSALLARTLLARHP